MRRRRYARSRTLAAGGGAAAAWRAGAAPPADRRATIKDLESRRSRSTRTRKRRRQRHKAMENYRRFLELQKTDPQLRAEAMRRLGDLNLEAGEVERMENEVSIDRPAGRRGHQALHHAAQGLSRLRAQRPGALPAGARLRDHRPAGAGARHARSHRAAAIRSSPQIDEVQFRRGELLFSAKRYPDAEQAYAVVIARGAVVRLLPAEPLQARLVAVQAVAHDESLPSFAGVLDQRARRRATASRCGSRTLKRADRELVEDTLRVMSITFSYNEGAASLEQFMHRTANAPYAHLLYSRLGDLYVDKQRYQDAADGVPRVRDARSQQRLGAGPGDAGHRGLSQGRLQPSWCSRASTSSSSATTSARRSGRRAAAPTTRTSCRS